MAWSPSGKVEDCRDIAAKWGGKGQVIIIAIDRRLETITMATYGETKGLCDDAKRLGVAAYGAVCKAYISDEVLGENYAALHQRRGLEEG